MRTARLARFMYWLASTPRLVAPLEPVIPSGTVLAVAFSGAEGATAAVDLSDSAHVLTFSGTAAIDTDESAFGLGSLLLPGGVGDYVTIPHSADFQFGTGAFTIEFMLYVVSLTPAGVQFLVAFDNGTDSERAWSIAYNTNALQWFRGTGATAVIDLSVALSSVGLGWHHIAICEDGTTNADAIKLFVDGVLAASDNGGTLLDAATSPLRLGINSKDTPDNPGACQIEWLRIVKGTALYTENFTPPIAYWQPGA